LNAAAIKGIASKNLYALLYKEEEDEEEPSGLACVGAGLGGGYQNTMELHAMTSPSGIRQWKKSMSG